MTRWAASRRVGRSCGSFIKKVVGCVARMLKKDAVRGVRGL
jgi:hypothetical protein